MKSERPAPSQYRGKPSQKLNDPRRMPWPKDYSRLEPFQKVRGVDSLAVVKPRASQASE
jgi:hypothetical protein